MTAKSELLAQIDALVEKQTFSLDAVAAINALRDTAKNTQTRLEGVVNDNMNLRQDKGRLETDIDALKKERQELQEKIKKMEETFEKGKEAIYTAQKHEARAEAYRESMKIVFAPNTIRESISKTLPVITPNSGGYVSNQNQSEYTDRTEGNAV